MKNFDDASVTWDQEQYRVDRAAFIANRIREIVPESIVGRIADIGCGTGLLGFNFVNTAKELELFDTSSGMIDAVDKKIKDNNYKNAKSHCIPTGKDRTLADLEYAKYSNHFDLIVNLMMLHHVEEHTHLMKTMARMLRSGGILCLCDLEKEDGSFHAPEVVPHNGFDRSEIMGILEKVGLRVITDEIVFHNTKIIDGKKMDFPLFLIAGKKRSR